RRDSSRPSNPRTQPPLTSSEAPRSETARAVPEKQVNEPAPPPNETAAVAKELRTVAALGAREPVPVAAPPRATAAAPPDPPQPDIASSPPTLGLEPSRQPLLIYTQAGNPTPEMPIVYRERAFAVDSLLTDEELADCLRLELAILQQDLRTYEQVKYVQLAL